MADTKATSVKVRFLVATKFGFAADTPGHEAKKLNDDWVTDSVTFEEGDEYEFPASEFDAVKAIIADGLAVRVTGKEKPAEPAAESHASA